MEQPKLDLPKIVSRFDDAEQKALEKADFYRGLTTYQDKKDARAKLRKLAKDIEGMRREFTVNLDDIKKQLIERERQATKPLLELAAEYDNDIKEADEKAREEKRQKILAIRGATIYLDHFEFDEKWLNKTTSLDEIGKQIQNGVEEINKNQMVIESTVKALGLPDSAVYMDMLKNRAIDEVSARMVEDAELLKKSHEREKEGAKTKDDEEETQSFSVDIVATNSQYRQIKNFVAKLGAKIIEADEQW